MPRFVGNASLLFSVGRIADDKTIISAVGINKTSGCRFCKGPSAELRNIKVECKTCLMLACADFSGNRAVFLCFLFLLFGGTVCFPHIKRNVKLLAHGSRHGCVSVLNAGIHLYIRIFIVRDFRLKRIGKRIRVIDQHQRLILCAVRIRKKIIKLDGVCGDGNSLWEAAFMKRCSEIIPKLEDKILVT